MDGEVHVNETAIAANIQAIADLATDVALNRDDIDFLLSQQPNPPKYIYLNGTSAYLNFAAGGGDYLDLTKSWSVGIRLEGLPDNDPDSHPLSCFGSGKVALTLKRESAPLVGNWGGFMGRATKTSTRPTRAGSLTLGTPRALLPGLSGRTTTKPAKWLTGCSRWLGGLSPAELS